MIRNIHAVLSVLSVFSLINTAFAASFSYPRASEDLHTQCDSLGILERDHAKENSKNDRKNDDSAETWFDNQMLRPLFDH